MTTHSSVIHASDFVGYSPAHAAAIVDALNALCRDTLATEGLSDLQVNALREDMRACPELYLSAEVQRRTGMLRFAMDTHSQPYIR